jgi:hypothetical protein
MFLRKTAFSYAPTGSALLKMEQSGQLDKNMLSFAVANVL